MKLTERAIWLGHIVDVLLGQCSQIKECLFEEIEESLPREFELGCPLTLNSPDRKITAYYGGVEIYRGECFIFRLRRDLKENALDFLKFWKILIEQEVEPRQRHRAFYLSLKGILTLYFSSTKVPFISRELIEKLKNQFSQNPRKFFRDFEKELIETHPYWAAQFSKIAIDWKLTSSLSWGKILFLLKIYLEGFKPVEAFNPGLIDEILDFLKKERGN